MPSTGCQTSARSRALAKSAQVLAIAGDDDCAAAVAPVEYDDAVAATTVAGKCPKCRELSSHSTTDLLVCPSFFYDYRSNKPNPKKKHKFCFWLH